ncbi:MAG: mannitol dehydrogenase family protein [Silicimonas sp.]
MRLTRDRVRFRYDRDRVTPGIVHIGVGAFFRAHAATYIDDILAMDASWGVIGVSMRRTDTRDALAPQGFCYTVAVKGMSGTECRVIGALLSILDATTQRDDVLAAMCDPGVRIVSLTVTEKGYCHDPATGRIDRSHPDIRHDLEHPETPVSAPGLILRALELRRDRRLPPFTVLCCDNLPANGHTTASVVAGFAALRAPELEAYVRNEVHFPSTMVDRIVPATTDADRAQVLEVTGLEDAWPVVTESFTQWVIEDDFPTGRPDFRSVGARMVADVRDFELMKLRMLNGSHSTLAYLGYLAGYETISEAMEDAALARLVREMMIEEIRDTLPASLGDLVPYAGELLERFANPALKHRTWQIAMDGSQKLPQRLLSTIRDRLANGQPIDRLALGVAAWMRYVTGTDEAGQPIDVRDPLAERLRGVFEGVGWDAEKLVNGYLSVGEVFGSDLPQLKEFRGSLVRHLDSLIQRGVAGTLRHRD